MRNICVVTGTRAEYGLLYWLILELKQRESFNLQIIVTGSHLVGGDKATVREIEAAGFKVDACVDMMLASDDPVAVSKSMGLGIIGISNELARLRPELLVILGDRYEALAAAQSAMFLRIPIAHIHGGEATEGLIDEAIRHSITKMSHLHFVAAQPFRKRVLQLGEKPENIHVVGAMGLDNINQLVQVEKKDIEEFLEVKLNKPLFLVTYHPVTLLASAHLLVRSLFDALDEFPDASIVFTGSNMDPEGQKIDEAIRSYTMRNSNRSVYKVSLGATYYLSLMRYADAVIGNSSSGLLEAPYIGVPTVNIGPRQQGRLLAPSVISCKETTEEIVVAIQRAMEPGFIEIARQCQTPYGVPGGSKKIVDILESVSYDNLLIKQFQEV